MRGYRDPDPEEEFDEPFRFEDQFEHDGYGLTFSKYGRGRPVRVTPEERDASIERFERFDPYFGQATVAAVIAWMVTFLSWGGEGWWSEVLLVTGLAAIGVTSWWAQRRLWSGAVSHFERRAPVGPERTRIDQYRSKASALSWAKAVSLVLFCMLALWFIDFSRPIQFLDAAKIGLALAGIVGLALLKALGQRRLS